MINPKRYLLLPLLSVLAWGFVFVLPAGLAADPDGATLPVAPSPTNGTAEATAPRTKSQNVTINLIHRLVERGVLSAEDARELIQQAENDAAEARAQSAKTGSDQVTNDTVTIHYIPEIVKAQIRDEIEGDVMQQARIEHWASPNSLPSWVDKFLVYGDVRMRDEEDLFPKGNANNGTFLNYNAINTGAPFDRTGADFPPLRDVDQDRNRVRLRVRLGAEVNMGDGFTAGLRLATGQDDQPVSQNQSLGAANNAQGGDFAQYAVWLDRGFLKYETGGTPSNNLAVSAGRFDNPFFSTSIIWYELLAFDGLALQGRREVVDGVTPFITAGAFPIFDTDFNFSSNRPQKYPSEDKWLYAAQVGTDWKINKDFSAKTAGAFYYFDNVEGKKSSPYTPLTSADQGNTDDTRPSFAQYGNTYFPLRNITPTAANNFGAIDQWQYFGLATPFQDFAFTERIDYKHFEPFVISLTGEFIKNVAYDQSHLNAVAVNNRVNGSTGAFVGGDTAWIVGLNVGNVALQKRGDWDINLDYRYVESDSVIDGFCDPDFGGGGTNVKGYSIRAALALTPKVFVQVRWYSSDQVAGPTLKADTFMFDVNGRF